MILQPDESAYDFVKSAESLHSLMANDESNILKNCLIDHTKVKNNFLDHTFLNLHITPNHSDQLLILGHANFSNPAGKISKVWFQVNFSSISSPLLKTSVIVNTSSNRKTFSDELLKKSTKNNYKFAAITAVALVALLIPAGVFAGGYVPTEDFNALSEPEGLTHLATLAIANGNYADARHYATQALQLNPGDLVASSYLRDAYANLEPYSSMVLVQDSMITMDHSTGMVMYFPDKDGAGYVIPRENPNGSVHLDYPGTVPIVYPINGEYPVVIFDRINPDRLPVIIAPDDPNLLDRLSQINTDEKIVVKPFYQDDPRNNSSYPVTFFEDPNDPIVIHPFGFGGDVPTIVFPDQTLAPAVLSVGNIVKESYQSALLDAASSDHVYVLGVDQTTGNFDVLIPVQFETVTFDDLEDIPGHVPVRIFSDGPDRPPIQFPLGTDFRPVITLAQSAGQQPTVQQPTVQQPTVQQPTVQQPTVQQPTVQQPTVQQPTVQQPTVQQPSNEVSNPIANAVGFGSEGGKFHGSFDSSVSGGSHVNIGTTVAISINAGINPNFDFKNTIIDNSNPNSEKFQESDGSEEFLAKPFSKNWYLAMSILPDGDPIVFSLDGETEPCTERREMGSHESTYWNFNLYSTEPPIMLNMNRNLCEGTYILGIDRNSNGKLDSGYEIMWHHDFDAFQLLHNIDYYEGTYDGFFDSEDPLWADALVMNSDYDHHHPEDLGIKAVSYHGSDMNRFADDQYGVGVYADEVNVSDSHFRIIVHAPTAIILENNSTTEAFGAVEGPLWDCTIHDVRYHVAEKMTGEFLRVEDPEDSTSLYVDALDFCNDFEAANENPDKYLSHWIAGIASMEHKKGLTDFNMLLQSKDTYEEALEMSPDNPFYNVDYCLVNRQLGYSTDECIADVKQAIDDRPDVPWFQQVHVILTGNVYR